MSIIQSLYTLTKVCFLIDPPPQTPSPFINPYFFWRSFPFYSELLFLWTLCLILSGSGFPPRPPGRNGYRKSDCLVDYPPYRATFPLWPFSPNGKWAFREFGIAVAIFLKWTNQNRKEQRHFYGINRTGNGSFLQGSNKCDLFWKLICKFNNHIHYKKSIITYLRRQSVVTPTFRWAKWRTSLWEQQQQFLSLWK